MHKLWFLNYKILNYRIDQLNLSDYNLYIKSIFLLFVRKLKNFRIKY
jgi:hypothetical protein